MKKVVFASMLVVAFMVPAAAPAALAQEQESQSQITIKDPAEYNAYTNAIGQSTAAAKAAAIESFLQQYPNSVVKQEMLEQLVGAYQATGDTAKTFDAAKRLLQVDPSNLRALTFVVYVEKTQANQSACDQAKLDDAAADAQRGLTATKPASMDQASFDKLKSVATPIFYSSIASDDLCKKDYKDAIDALTSELKSDSPAQTTQQPSLADTYYLGTAYVQEDSKNPDNLKNGIWYLARAAQYLPDPYKTTSEKAAEYWYNKYHGSMDGFSSWKPNPDGTPVNKPTVVSLAQNNVLPPADYAPTPAPPPPSPAQLAHQAIASTSGCADVTPAPPAAPANTNPGSAPAPTPATTPAAPASFPAACTDSLKKSLGLTDREFILANGAPPDQQLIWSIMNGVTAEVPGAVISATANSVQLAVSDDAKQSNKADFTINMKTPLKDVPTPGTSVTYVATFDSYTQNPPMIIMKDGGPKPAPVHHPTTRRRTGNGR
jgi:hypothetical protein